MVWPIVTVTNFEGFTRQQFHIFAKLLCSEALKICRSNYHHSPHHLSHSCGHTPFHTHINLIKDHFFAAKAEQERTLVDCIHICTYFGTKFDIQFQGVVEEQNLSKIRSRYFLWLLKTYTH